MTEERTQGRRHFLSFAAKAMLLSPLATVAIPGESFGESIGKTLKANAPLKNNSINYPFTVIKQIDAGDLSIGYVDEGPADGPVIILLHGWPYDIHSYAEVVPLLTAKGYRTIVPHLRGYGTTKFLSNTTLRNGQQSAIAADIIALMDALQIDRAVIAGFDWGARTADIMAALWPGRCKALVSVSGYLIGNQESGKIPLSPAAELQWWYQFYFATERGRAGYAHNTEAFAKLIWQLASPQWKFSDAVFGLSAASLKNPDHVDIVIHNYRWRLGLAAGEDRFNKFENQLAKGPLIAVPTITIEGDSNGAPHPDARSYASRFTRKYIHKIFRGVGHNPPQESPRAFAEAVMEADSFAR